MKDVLIHFKANGIEYPLAFNINVIEIMQDKFGSITGFSKALSPTETIDGEEAKKEPRMSDVKFIYKECINEGIDIENEGKAEQRPFLTEKQVGRIIGSITDTAGTIKQLVVKSNDSGLQNDDDEEGEKNLTTGQ
jgi:hypothetical protein